MEMPRKGFPQYTVFGTSAALSIRAILPNFKRAGTDGVSVDRRGKLIVEFIPRKRINTGTGLAWNDKTLFTMTVEEVGLCLSQLPENVVELSHPTVQRGYNNNEATGGDEDEGGVTQLAGDDIFKVMTIEAGEGSTLTWKLDYFKDGVGGQTPPGIEGLPYTPMEVTMQAGECEIFKSICQTSIPYLLGWNTTMDIASAAAISRGIYGHGRNNTY